MHVLRDNDTSTICHQMSLNIIRRWARYMHFPLYRILEMQKHKWSAELTLVSSHAPLQLECMPSLSFTWSSSSHRPNSSCGSHTIRCGSLVAGWKNALGSLPSSSFLINTPGPPGTAKYCSSRPDDEVVDVAADGIRETGGPGIVAAHGVGCDIPVWWSLEVVWTPSSISSPPGSAPKSRSASVVSSEGLSVPWLDSFPRLLLNPLWPFRRPSFTWRWCKILETRGSLDVLSCKEVCSPTCADSEADFSSRLLWGMPKLYRAKERGRDDLRGLYETMTVYWIAIWSIMLRSFAMMSQKNNTYGKHNQHNHQSSLWYTCCFALIISN